MTQSEGSAARRLRAITVDQAISGGSNFAIAILAAHLLSAASFGFFGIAFLIYVTAVGIHRALVNEPLLVQGEEAERRPGAVLGSALVVAAACGAAVLVVALAVRPWLPELSVALLVLASCTPLLLVQDTGRYLGIATRRPGFALGLDLVWLGVLVVGAALLVLLDVRTLGWFILVWAGSGAIAAVPVLWRFRRGGIAPALHWLRETWGLAARYLLSFGASQGGALVAAFALAGIAGAAALGAVQGALLLVRPYSMFQIAAMASGVSEIARERADDDVALVRHARRTTVVATVVAVLNAVVLVVLPDWAGHIALGDLWERAEPLMVPAGVQILCLGLFTGARAAILGRKQMSTAVAVDVFAIVLLVACGVVGTVLGAALGYYWGVALGQAVVMLVWWGVFLLRSRSGGSHRA